MYFADHPLAEQVWKDFTVVCNTCDHIQLYNAFVNSSLFTDVYFDDEPIVNQVCPGGAPVDLSTPDNPQCTVNAPLQDPYGWINFDHLRIREAWCITKGDSRIKIGISDRGFDLNYPSIIGSEIINPLGGTACGGKYHGTKSAAMAAGIEGSGYASVAPNSSLILTSLGFSGMLRLGANGAKIINCSWHNSSLDCRAESELPSNVRAVGQILYDNDIIIVGAAGNGANGAPIFGSSCTDECNTLDPLDGGPERDPGCCDGDPNTPCGPIEQPAYRNRVEYPSGLSTAIAVSSFDRNGSITFDAPDPCVPNTNPPYETFSHNSTVDLLAQGFCLFFDLDWIENNTTCTSLGPHNVSAGNSIAAPQISGLISLLLAVEPCLNRDDVMDIIEATGQDYSNCMWGNNDNDYRPNEFPTTPNAYEALVYLQNLSFGEYNISTNTVWNGETKFVRSLRVETGAELKLENSTLKIAPDAQIIVERGARLIVDNSTLTNAGCTDGVRDRWNSIYVFGNADRPHPQNPETAVLDPLDAGVLVIRNNSVIENAGTAISTQSRGIPYPTSSDYLGGIVIAEYSTFRNNWRSVEFMKYDGGGTYDNESKFSFCEFVNVDYTPIFATADDPGVDFFVSPDNGYGVTIWDCHGIEFENSTFRNMGNSGVFGIDYSAEFYNGNEFENSRRGIVNYVTKPLGGVLTVDGSLSYPNRFRNISEQAILTNASNRITVMEVNDNEFENCFTGIWIEGETNSQIFKNNFFLSNDADQEGVVYLNSSTYNNQFFNNNTSNYDRSLVAAGDNSTLAIEQNCFFDNVSDITVMKVPGPNPARMQTQGMLNMSASNCFDLSTAIDHYDIFISGSSSSVEPFTYFMPQAGTAAACYYPEDDFPAVVDLEHATAYENSCNQDEPESPGIYDLQIIRADYLTARTDYLNDLSDLTKRINYEQKRISYGASAVKSIFNWIQGGKTAAQIAGDLDLNEPLEGRLMYSVYVEMDDSTSADNLLNTLYTNQLISQSFYATQKISLSFNPEINKIGLSTTDSLVLHNVSNSYHPDRGYARALMSLAEGVEFPFVLPSPANPQSRPTLDNTIEQSVENLDQITEISVFPNPVQDQLSIEYKAGVVCQINIFNLGGEKLYTSEFIGSTRIDRQMLFSQGRTLSSGQILMARITTEDGRSKVVRLLF
ncbi:MAG: S8 family serine peptidase [Bacteroidota bacterium]